MMTTLSKEQVIKLNAFLQQLIDQRAATILVPPQSSRTGFWFGGGNMVQTPDGRLWLCGRYRNYGDSRTGLAAGERGLECALFVSDNNGRSFTKIRSWSKADLSKTGEVLSIEGTALHQHHNGTWELFISTEKKEEYPQQVQRFLKPGAGRWSIDRMTGDSIETLDAASLEGVLKEEEDACYLHVKDPVVFDHSGGDTVLIYCSHPFCWSSSNCGCAVRKTGTLEFVRTSNQLLERGPAWDVAVSRITDHLKLPQVGAFAELPPLSVFFYDGAECVRSHQENPHAVTRPRGCSCEEIGGACYSFAASFADMTRLSYEFPLFTSPYGTGCSRYVATLLTEDGIFASWQQSQEDLSQPLVGHFLSMDRVEGLLS